MDGEELWGDEGWSTLEKEVVCRYGCVWRKQNREKKNENEEERIGYLLHSNDPYLLHAPTHFFQLLTPSVCLR